MISKLLPQALIPSTSLMTECMVPRLRGDDSEVLLPRPYNHFFHLKNTYGSTAASSIMTSAIG
jgi:hypothetical protein